MSDISIPLLFAHRGGKTDAPENTLAAFRWVAENRIPAVELDVHRCATGELDIIEKYKAKHFLDRDTKFYVAEHHIAPMIIIIVVAAQRSISAYFVEFIIRYISA